MFRYVLTLVVLLLAGCIPAPMGKYYRPSMQGLSTSYSGSDCHGQAGAPAVLDAELAPGVTARVDAMVLSGTREASRTLHIVLSIARGTEVQFMGNTLQIAKGRDAWQTLRVPIDVSAARLIPSGVVMAEIAPTATSAIDSATFRARAVFYYELPHYVPEQFTMSVPAIRVVGDGTVPAATFDAVKQRRPERYKGEYRDHQSLIYTTPESRARLAQKLEACRSAVAARAKGFHCENLPLYDDGGLIRSMGPFALTGRWYVFNVEEGKPFNGELSIEYKKPLDWAFVSDELTLQDNSGQVTRVSLQTMRVFFSYEAPLDTAVHGVNDTSPSDATTLSIQVPLGTAEGSNYRIKLPPMRVNGTVYQVPPIDLEKRLFDIGLEPFNC